MVGLILFGVPAAIIAKVKGFKSLRWLLALGIVGLITVICFSSANENGISGTESLERSERADKVGAWMCGINVAVTVLGVFVVLATS